MRRNRKNARIACSQRSHRALLALIPLSLAATLGLGCSGDFPSAEITAESAPSNDAAENALIESYLADRGFDTSNLQFEGDEVILEGGVGVQRAVLLDAAQAKASGEVEKGYFNPAGAKFPGNRIGVTFAANVSQAWRDAYIKAAAEWNTKTPGFATLAAPVNLKTIVVSNDAQDILNSSIAIATRPLKIQINPDFEDAKCPNTNIEQLPVSSRTPVRCTRLATFSGSPTRRRTPRATLGRTSLEPP